MRRLKKRCEGESTGLAKEVPKRQVACVNENWNVGPQSVEKTKRARGGRKGLPRRRKGLSQKKNKKPELHRGENWIRRCRRIKHCASSDKRRKEETQRKEKEKDYAPVASAIAVDH